MGLLIAFIYYFMYICTIKNVGNMKNNKPKRISFSEVRSIAKEMGAGVSSLPFMSKDIGMLSGGSASLSHLLKLGTPYIIEDCRIAMIKRGKVIAQINMIEHTITSNTMIFIGAGCIVQPKSFSPDLDFRGMMISNEKLNIALNGNIPTSIATNGTFLLVDITYEEAYITERMFQLIWSLLHQENYPEGTLNGLLNAMIHYYDGLNKRNESISGNEKSRNRMIFEKFIQLINTYSKKEHSLNFYADKMCITPRYLGVVVKNTSGVTAKEWIDRAVVTSAKVMLKHGNKQIVQISDELCFPNPSFFCKFFKRMTGMTPQEYRTN